MMYSNNTLYTKRGTISKIFRFLAIIPNQKEEKSCPANYVIKIKKDPTPYKENLQRDMICIEIRKSLITKEPGSSGSF